jgi:hypothetical protein
MTQENYGSTYYTNHPIFCSDGEFLEHTYRQLQEFERSVFHNEMDDE